jgi:hypothetical protein
MAAGPDVTTFVDQLVDLFNRRSLDLPDGYITRHTQFLLNGVPFEETLGRSPTDPLVLMLARGPAGYRFIAKALQHAIPDATLQQGEFVDGTEGAARVVRGQCWLSGHTRGDGDRIEAVVGVEMRLRGDRIERVNATVDAQHVSRLRAARLRP